MWTEGVVQVVIEGFDEIPATVVFYNMDQVDIRLSEDKRSITLPIESWGVDHYSHVMRHKMLGWLGVVMGEYEKGDDAFNVSLKCFISEIRYRNRSWWITFVEGG